MANNNPIFRASVLLGIANLSSANTNRTVSGVTGLVQVVPSAATDAEIDEVVVQATATTTAGMIRLWLFSGSGNAQLCAEIPVSAITPGANTPAFAYTQPFSNLRLPAGYSLYASTHNAETFNVIANGGKF